MPKVTETKADDPELEAAKDRVLADIMGKLATRTKKDWTARTLSQGELQALKILRDGTAFEVVERTVQFGDDKVDPITKQVRPYEKQQGLIVTVTLEPEEKGWIEHLMKALQNTMLSKKEVELFRKHIRRLNVSGALRDYYEFYGLTLKELKEKEQEYRQQGHLGEADRIKKVIERNK
jgi:hypothetical protein